MGVAEAIGAEVIATGAVAVGSTVVDRLDRGAVVGVGLTFGGVALGAGAAVVRRPLSVAASSVVVRATSADGSSAA